MRGRRNESGSALVVIVPLLFGMLAMAALVTSGGHAMVVKAQLRTAAEAAARGAVAALWLPDGAPIDATFAETATADAWRDGLARGGAGFPEARDVAVALAAVSENAVETTPIVLDPDADVAIHHYASADDTLPANAITVVASRKIEMIVPTFIHDDRGLVTGLIVAVTATATGTPASVIGLDPESDAPLLAPIAITPGTLAALASAVGAPVSITLSTDAIFVEVPAGPVGIGEQLKVDATRSIAPTGAVLVAAVIDPATHAVQAFARLVLYDEDDSTSPATVRARAVPSAVGTSAAGCVAVPIASDSLGRPLPWGVTLAVAAGLDGEGAP